MDNDGENNALHIYQSGGNSKGGKGAENDLSRYLKELHHRIKTSWSPPRGTTHKAELLFRIKKDGSLAFIKVALSSGENDTDASTIKAIIAAHKHQYPLPASFQASFLDVIYTFKYNVDELREVSHSSLPK